MSKAKARVFVPLYKVDEEQRLVFGRITAEEVDQSGEVMDYETSKPNFEKWSSDIEQSSGGLSKGNLRVMHGLSVAGKLTDLAFDDDSKAIEVCAKVVDDAEWEKVKEGCYTGFSVGGRYGKKWKDTVDGNTITKFTAVPNEVSLVDNPCVKSATFSLVKADGAEEAVEFKKGLEMPNDDTCEKPKKKKKETKKVDHTEPRQLTNEEVVAKAEELAKAADDGSTWMDHVVSAREELLKADTLLSTIVEGQEADDDSEEDEDDIETAEGTEEEETGEDTDTAKAEKVTPPGVKQVWTASDGKTFEKKADAEAHEATLVKTEEPKTEADELRDRLNKALTEEPPVEETPLIEDFDRLSKAINALSTPFDEKGEPALQKGMYTINRFSNVLSDMASLSRSIKAEGKREGDDGDDASVSDELIAAVKSLGKTFISYATEQVKELLAGMDDDVMVSYHDYYYCAAQNDPENELAKDVTSLITDYREPSRELRETLAKSFGYIEGVLEVTDELSPPMQKRFDALEAENTELKKVAGEAIEKVEELAKRIKAIEETPLPRAPRGLPVEKGSEFFGKQVNSREDRVAVLQEMMSTYGPDELATMMIKASQASGGHKLSLKS